MQMDGPGSDPFEMTTQSFVFTSNAMLSQLAIDRRKEYAINPAAREDYVQANPAIPVGRDLGINQPDEVQWAIRTFQPLFMDRENPDEILDGSEPMQSVLPSQNGMDPEHFEATHTCVGVATESVGIDGRDRPVAVTAMGRVHIMQTRPERLQAGVDVRIRALTEAEARETGDASGVINPGLQAIDAGWFAAVSKKLTELPGYGSKERYDEKEIKDAFNSGDLVTVDAMHFANKTNYHMYRIATRNGDSSKWEDFVQEAAFATILEIKDSCIGKVLKTTDYYTRATVLLHPFGC